MSSKTRTRKARITTTTGTTRTVRSVPDQPTAATVRTDTEDKLWAALHANPNSTAADLSAAARVGKSTAQKILVKWAGDGSVTRTAGITEGGRRAADLWAITDIDAAPGAAAAVDQGDADLADNVQTTPDSPVVPDPTDAALAEEDPAEPTNAEPTDAVADDAQDTADTEAGDTAEAELVVAEATKPAVDSVAAKADTATDGGGGKEPKRLAPGALRGMVEDYLRDHPGEEFSPTTIAKALGGKSSGAVSNALDKLVDDGTAVKTQDKPRRFALAPTETSADTAAR
jgi:hypothetical protein